MKGLPGKELEKGSQSMASQQTGKQNVVQQTFQLIDSRPEVAIYQKMQALADSHVQHQRIKRSWETQPAVIQRVVAFPVTENYDGTERGRRMEATDLNVFNVGGGTTTTGVDLGGSNFINRHNATKASPFSKQMHLLNNNLGGSGTETRNLGWGSAGLNLQHHLKVEDHLNKAIDLQGQKNNAFHNTNPDYDNVVIDKYNVELSYYQPNARPFNYPALPPNPIEANQIRNEVESARGAMIEKLRFTARYRPQPGVDMIDIQGTLLDQRGVDEMGSLAYNQHDEHVQLLDPVNNPETQLGWKDNINEADNNYVRAATVRSPRPPQSINDVLTSVCRKYEGEIRGILNDIYKSRAENKNTALNYIINLAAQRDERIEDMRVTDLAGLENVIRDHPQLRPLL